MILTVAIPTFNRNEILKKHIQTLLPQLTSDCRLLIIDNCSDIPVADTLREILNAYPSIQVEIKRNKTNIGGNANILRCFEYCETEWMWMLGDDDLPEPNAVETIFNDIRENSNVIHLNYYCPDPIHPLRNALLKTKGLLGYLEGMDFFGSMIFISSNLYRVQELVPHLGLANFYQYSCAPQFVALALALGDDKECILSNKILVTNKRDETPASASSSSLYIANGLPSLLTLPFSLAVRKLLQEKVVKRSTQNWITAEHILYNLLVEWRLTNDVKLIRYKYRLCLRNYLSYNKGLFFRIKLIGIWGMLLFPSLGFAIMARALKVLKRDDKLVIEKRREI